MQACATQRVGYVIKINLTVISDGLCLIAVSAYETETDGLCHGVDVVVS